MILLAENTRSQLENALNSSAHALLFTGPEGAGKAYVARYFAAQKLDLKNIAALDKHPYFRFIAPEDNTVSIEQIRQLQKFLQLKTPGTAGTRRAIILENAHLMTNEAQNALLKSLEEPPADTIIILTAPRTLRLRETIYSRVQQVPVHAASKAQAADYFGKQYKPEQIEHAFAMSAGHIGLLHALLHDQDHMLRVFIQSAKELLAMDMFGRLAKVDEMSRQKDQLPQFLYACKLISASALEQAANKQNRPQVKQWHRRLQAVYQAEASLPHNPNAKLLLTDLLLNM